MRYRDAVLSPAQRRSSWALAALFTYYAIDRWLPLGAWNGQRGFPVDNDQALLDVITLAVLAVGLISVRAGNRPGMVIVTAGLGLWTYFHLSLWWWHYLVGVDPADRAFHDQFLAHTQILPRVGDHLPPDGEHAVIDFLLLPATVLTLYATIERLRRRPAP
jgi:hypothetical protein